MSKRDKPEKEQAMITKTKLNIPVHLTTDDLKEAAKNCDLETEVKRLEDEAVAKWLTRRGNMTQAERDREDEQLAGLLTPA